MEVANMSRLYHPLVSFTRALSRDAAGPICRRLDNKVAIVTGGTKGIGFGITKRLAEEGSHVMICGRRQDNLNNALDELRAMGHRNVSGMICNVSYEDDLKALVEKTKKVFGGIDILVNNAAVNPVNGKLNPLEFDKQQWSKLMTVNVVAPNRLVGLCVPEMKKRGQGSVVNISSFAGINPMIFIGPYSVSKAALNMLTRVLASHLMPDNIRVNAIACGFIETEFVSQTVPSVTEYLLNMYQVQKQGVPEDIAKVAAFLASDDSSYVSGQILQATGGPASNMPLSKKMKDEFSELFANAAAAAAKEKAAKKQ